LPRLEARGLAALFLMLTSTMAVAAEIVDASYVEAALARGAIVWDVRGFVVLDGN
jgi:hypothetical protein